jgi:hypothetical protein
MYLTTFSLVSLVWGCCRRASCAGNYSERSSVIYAKGDNVFGKVVKGCVLGFHLNLIRCMTSAFKKSSISSLRARKDSCNEVTCVSFKARSSCSMASVK